LGDLGRDGRIILKWFIANSVYLCACTRVHVVGDWIELVQNMVWGHTYVNRIMKLKMLSKLEMS